MAKFGIKDFENFFDIKYDRKQQRLCLFQDNLGNCQHPVERTGWLWNQCDGSSTITDFCQLVRQKSPEAHILCTKHQKTRRDDHNVYHDPGLNPIDELMKRVLYESRYAFIPDNGHAAWYQKLLRELNWMTDKQKIDLMEMVLNHLGSPRQKRASLAAIFNRINECRKFDC